MKYFLLEGSFDKKGAAKFLPFCPRASELTWFVFHEMLRFGLLIEIDSTGVTTANSPAGRLPTFSIFTHITTYRQWASPTPRFNASVTFDILAPHTCAPLVYLHDTVRRRYNAVHILLYPYTRHPIVMRVVFCEFKLSLISCSNHCSTVWNTML